MALRLANDSVVPSSIDHPSRSASLARVPAEIIHHIIRFLDPLELIRLQTVSKQFHAIVNDPSVWRTTCKRTCLPHPPGPFPWQSARFLQRNLIRSARLAQTWTSQPMKIISSRKVFHDIRAPDPNHPEAVCYHWVSKRWRIAHRAHDVVSQDIDTGSQQTLWNSDRRIRGCKTCSIMCAQGHLIYLLLREEVQVEVQGQRDVVKLLEFQADDDSGHLSGPVVFGVPVRFPDEWLHLRVLSTNAPFLYISVDPMDYKRRTHTMIFDIRSRIFYKFPRFTSQLDEMQPSVSKHSLDFTILLSRTHIIVVSVFYLNDNNSLVPLVQAFVLPEDSHPNSNGTYELRLSHEVIWPGGLTLGLSLLRDSVVNSVDGTTTLRLLHYSPPRFFCTSLSLPKSQTNAVVRISLETQEILRIGDASAGAGKEILSIDNSFVRGVGKYGDFLYGFTIDASEDVIEAGFSEPSSVSPLASGTSYLPAAVQWFDGVRGRMCYMERCGESDSVYVTIVVDLE